MEEMLEILNGLRYVGGFKNMSQMDWDCFAGADEGSKIAYGTKFTFILSPTGNMTIHRNEDGTETEIGII